MLQIQNILQQFGRVGNCPILPGSSSSVRAVHRRASSRTLTGFFLAAKDRCPEKSDRNDCEAEPGDIRKATAAADRKTAAAAADRKTAASGKLQQLPIDRLQHHRSWNGNGLTRNRKIV